MKNKPETPAERVKNGTIVIPCAKGCKHTFQDQRYSGKRLHNLTKTNGARCTVCGNIYKF